MLINVDNSCDNILSSMMLVFCSAIRFSFKRLLEDVKICDLEKIVALKYNLNIRQAKDAVENARQTIASQKELVKLNYKNYTAKIITIENALKNNKLSEKKRKALLSKFDKRKRKQLYYKNFIDTNTIPSVIFGTKELFLKRCKGLISKQEWQNARNNRIYSRGDKTKSGNPNLRVIVDNDRNTFLEISTLEKTSTNRAVKIRVPLYLPQKVSKKTGKINGRDYKNMIIDYVKTGEAYQVELIKKNSKYYCHITFDEAKIRDITPIYTGHNALLGVDTNPDGFGLTLISRDGNYSKHIYLKQSELKYARSNRRTNLCGEISKQVINFAKQHNCGIAIEDLKFANDKDVGNKFARIKHQFIYSKLLHMLELCCKRNNVEIVKVKPQFTSKIGLYKYCHQYGMDVHNGAAMVIARRAYGLKEKVPKLLKYMFVKDDNISKFNQKNEWSKWSAINKEIQKQIKNIKMKGGTGFWQHDRKMILGLV